jgi:hypothetical protein
MAGRGIYHLLKRCGQLLPVSPVIQPGQFSQSAIWCSSTTAPQQQHSQRLETHPAWPFTFASRK